MDKEKKEKKRIYNQTFKERTKEKKRELIKKLKEERQENSLLFNQF